MIGEQNWGMRITIFREEKSVLRQLLWYLLIFECPLAGASGSPEKDPFLYLHLILLFLKEQIEAKPLMWAKKSELGLEAREANNWNQY